MITPSSWGISGMNGGMDDLELAEELLLDNHLFNILWQKLKKIQSQPSHLYPQISGSNPRSETRYTHETFKNLTVLTTHLSTLLCPLSPQRLNAFPRLNGNTAMGHLKTYRVAQRYRSSMSNSSASSRSSIPPFIPEIP